jgi:hypothetical protein
MRVRVLGALAGSDFRERTRRPAYLVTLAAAVALGYLALPPARPLHPWPNVRFDARTQGRSPVR